MFEFTYLFSKEIAKIVLNSGIDLNFIRLQKIRLNFFLERICSCISAMTAFFFLRNQEFCTTML